MGVKPEFWIDDRGYVYKVSDQKPWRPIYWIDKEWIYPLPGNNQEDKSEEPTENNLLITKITEKME